MTRHIRRFTARVLGQLAVVIFATLVVNVLWGVLTRYAFGQQASWSEELARFLLVWLAMLGAALAYIENSHLGVDVLTRPLHESARRLAHLTGHLLVLLFAAGVMVYGGGALFLERWDSGQLMPALQFRKAWFYLSVPVSGVLIALFALDATMTTFTGSAKPSGAKAGENP